MTPWNELARAYIENNDFYVREYKITKASIDNLRSSDHPGSLISLLIEWILYSDTIFAVPASHMLHNVIFLHIIIVRQLCENSDVY
uniref:Uncharacterized protein n=1 Tax=Heterorhabditis bacteriophora TaxID=37862 RepID=A0A1I7XCQ1_HETBA